MKAFLFFATGEKGGVGKSMSGSLSIDRAPISKAARATMAGGPPTHEKAEKKTRFERGYEWRRNAKRPRPVDRKFFRN